jgi:hypothetical protein
MAGEHKRAPFDEILAELRVHYTEEQIVELGCGFKATGGRR